MIYLDNAATTKLDHQAGEFMTSLLMEEYGNPSSAHSMGKKAKSVINSARSSAADLFKCRESEIYFTSGGTESNNWAIFGAAEEYRSRHRLRSGHIISSAIEHRSILKALEIFARSGGSYTLIEPDEKGRISPEQVKKAIKKDTFLISVMTANNEIGTIEPIRALGILAHEHGCLFHTDAVQAAGHIPMALAEGTVDILSASAHKMYGPKGIGLMYIREGVKLAPFIKGGMQEGGLRAGMENVLAIGGYGTAMESARMNMRDELKRVTLMADSLAEKLETIPGAVINGAAFDGGEAEEIYEMFNSSLPGIINVTIDGVRGDALVEAMDRKGVCISAGAALAGEIPEASYVIRALGKSEEEALDTIRFSIGKYNRMEEIDEAFKILKECVDQIRNSNFA